MKKIPRKWTILLYLLFVGVVLRQQTARAGNDDFFAPEVIQPNKTVGPITRGVIVEQQFVPIHDDMSSIYLLPAQLGPARQSTLILELRRRDDPTIIKSETISASTFVGEPLYRFEFPRQSDSRASVYLLTLRSPDADPANAVSAFLEPHTDDADTLRINNAAAPGRIDLTIRYADSPLLIGLTVLGIVLAVGLGVAWTAARPDKLRGLVQFVLCAACAAPMIFVIAMIQRGAITYPFWDEFELRTYFFNYYHGTLRLLDFFNSHAHTRPAVVFAVYFLNGLLTGWDIRSEFVIHIASICLGFFAQGWILFHALRRRFSVLFCATLLLESLLVFSPVGHNNHWWTFGSQHTFASLFIAVALGAMAILGRRWSGQICALIFCWLAIFSVTNGLIAMLVCAVMSQLLEENPLRPSWRTALWAAGFILTTGLYLRNLAETPLDVRGNSVLEIAWFVCAYIGTPLAAVFKFPYHANFENPGPHIGLQTAMGIGLIVFAIYSAWVHRRHLQSRSVAGMFFVGCTLFALGSAAITAWGRSNFDQNGAANATVSRYTIYSTHLLLGLLVLWSAAMQDTFDRCRTLPMPRRLEWFRLIGCIVFGVVVSFSVKMYKDSMPCYEDSHAFNRILAQAYEHAQTQYDDKIYPHADVAREGKLELYELRLGPYNNRP